MDKAMDETMSSIEDIEAAEARMSSAKDALFDYLACRESLDRDHYRALVARVKKAEAAFLKASSELGD